MAKYEIDKTKDKIVFEGSEFVLSDVERILLKAGYKLFEMRTCPGEIVQVLSEPAKQVMRNIKAK